MFDKLCSIGSRNLSLLVLWGLQQVAIYVDFKVDESYTPNKISIRAGNSFHDLRVKNFSNTHWMLLRKRHIILKETVVRLL